MRHGPSTARLFGIGLLAALATLAVMVALPHDRYIRWQDERTEAYARLGWAYERIHFDPTPLDIALVGTSHTMNGLDGLAVAQSLAATGARGPDGRCLTVTNLAIPAYGRNLHWAIVKELLGARKPRAIVLEVFENETRKAHPVFSHVADSADLLGAPVLFNQNYLADLIRLPYRQAKLWAESLSPETFGLKRRFSPADYDGSTVDNTRVVNAGGQALTPPLTQVYSAAELEQWGAMTRATKRLNILPKAFENYEYAVPQRYLPGIFAMAQARGVPVLLLYLPNYGQTSLPLDTSYFRGRRLLTMPDILAHKEWWHDPAHLNAAGAAQASARLGQLLASTGIAGKGDGACNFGIPARPITRPFVKRAPSAMGDS